MGLLWKVNARPSRDSRLPGCRDMVVASSPVVSWFIWVPISALSDATFPLMRRLPSGCLLSPVGVQEVKALCSPCVLLNEKLLQEGCCWGHRCEALPSGLMGIVYIFTISALPFRSFWYMNVFWILSVIRRIHLYTMSKWLIFQC